MNEGILQSESKSNPNICVSTRTRML